MAKDTNTVTKEQVESALNEIRAYLAADGGSVDLVGVDKGVVKVKLVGACMGCPMSAMTLQNVIERVIKEKVPEVKEVVAV